MQNEVINSLHNRKSVRIFEDRPVSDVDKITILEAAMQAPSAGCQQLYSILDITDQKLKDELAVSCDNQPFIAKAPVIFIFLADYRKWYDAFSEGGANPRKPEVGDLMLSVEDAVIAAQNAVTAAESLGIGSCYIGDIMEHYEFHRELLNLPEYVFPACMLIMGYPTEQQKIRKKPERCMLSDIVMANTYQEKDGAQLREMFAKECNNQTFDEWAKAFCNRKYNSDFSREMSRSIRMYLDEYSVK